jgi:hypothetical protein
MTKVGRNGVWGGGERNNNNNNSNNNKNEANVQSIQSDNWRIQASPDDQHTCHADIQNYTNQSI